MRHAPCKDCPDRKVDCHSECEKYKQFSEERKSISRMRIEEHVSRPARHQKKRRPW